VASVSECEQARAVIRAAAGGSIEAVSNQVAIAERHVATCDECYAALRSLTLSPPTRGGADSITCEEISDGIGEYAEACLEGTSGVPEFRFIREHMSRCTQCGQLLDDILAAVWEYEGLGRPGVIATRFGYEFLWIGARHGKPWASEVWRSRRLIREARYLEARGVLEAIRAERRDSAKLEQNAAIALYLEGEEEPALEVLQGLTSGQGGDIEAWNNRGVVLASLGRFAEARECFGVALGIDANDETVARNLRLCPDTGSPGISQSVNGLASQPRSRLSQRGSKGIGRG
jgi:tetratricopeptide (TPR) repeat protein